MIGEDYLCFLVKKRWRGRRTEQVWTTLKLFLMLFAEPVELPRVKKTNCCGGSKVKKN
jgi:hypothetical protein